MTRRRLYAADLQEAADIRPTLLGVVTLAFLLLFQLLATSSGTPLAVLLLDGGPSTEDASAADLAHRGVLSAVRLTLNGDGLATLDFEVQTTDIASASTAREQRTIAVPARPGGGLDVGALENVLQRVHGLDRTQNRARLAVSPTIDTATLLHALDALRGAEESPRFPDVALEDAE